MVVFYGEFQDQPRDYRYFAAYYVLLRILNLLLLFPINGNLYFLASAALFAQSSVSRHEPPTLVGWQPRA